MIHIGLCDDEKTMAEELSKKIRAYMDNFNIDYEVYSFTSGEALLDSGKDFELIFLDIQMQGINGMETAKKLRERGVQGFIIFVTVLKEYVYDAFEVEASDYLLKPLDDQHFKHTMDRVCNNILRDKAKHLIVKKGMWCRSVDYDDILYCEVINRKIYIHTNYGIIDYYNKIKELEKDLGKNFFRCHRSYLVNLKYVNGIEKGMAVLENKEEIPISRLRLQEFIEAVMTYMKDK